MKNKKAQVLSNLGALAVGIATFAIVITVALLVTSQTRDAIVDSSATGENSTAYNATITLAEAADDIPGWVPLIVIVAIGAAILGMIGMFRQR